MEHRQPWKAARESCPIGTFADWQESNPGFLELDLVANCSESTEGFQLTTSCAVDVASGWSECIVEYGAKASTG